MGLYEAEPQEKMSEPELVGCFEDALQFDHSRSC